jgi:leader peptidase (prepilin peptidase) / N-methyltransferase
MKMEAALATLAFLPGLAVGSFLSVVASRVPLRRSIARPGSACMSCGTPIAWFDMVPLISFLLLGGRCRRCDARIPWRDPAVELATAALTTGCVVSFGLTGRAAVAALFCAALVIVTATDLEHRIVPNRVVLPASGAVLVLHTAVSPSVEWSVGAMGAAGALFLVALAYPGGLGMGDVKLALLIGAMLGRTAPLALMLATLLALVPSAVLLAWHGFGARKFAIPFAPFLALGSVITLFAGDALLDVYLGILR